MLLLLCAAAAPPAAATTADDLCSPAADPCRVTRTTQVTPGSIIDVGTRSLVVVNRGALDLQSGTMTLRAAVFTVEAGGSVLARGTAQTPGGKVVVEAGQITINGNIDASGAPGGVVMLFSTGSVMLAGPLEVRSRDTESGAGSAEITGTDITITGAGRINALGGGEDFGGDVDINASGALTIGGEIDASGGEGGTIILIAGGNASVAAAVEVKSNASAASGSGGEVNLDAGGIVTMSGVLSTFGRNGSADTGAGDGGSIDVSGSAILAPSVNAQIIVNAGSPDGVGGDMELTATSGAIDYQGRIEARGPGVDGSGGSITIDAIGAVSVGGVFDARGGRDGGGDIDLASGENMMIAQTASLTVAADSSGNGGDIDGEAEGNLTVRGTLNADGGPTEGGNGGAVTLRGCAVRIEDGSRLTSLRTAGTNTVIGRDSTVVAGIMRADVGSGRNVFRYPGIDYEPAFLPGSQIQPPPTLIEDVSVVPCNAVATRTPTFTRTAGPSPTVTNTRRPTNTPTSMPSTCVGDCDNSGVVTISDLILGVNIVIGSQPVSVCPAFDPNDSGTVTINELIIGVNNSLAGCP